MSKVLIGSINRRMPASFSLPAANFRFLTRVACASSLLPPFGWMPARQFTCLTPSAFAYWIALPTPSSNTATRSGWQAIPRSPAPQGPAGGGGGAGAGGGGGGGAAGGAGGEAY